MGCRRPSDPMGPPAYGSVHGAAPSGTDPSALPTPERVRGAEGRGGRGAPRPAGGAAPLAGVLGGTAGPQRRPRPGRFRHHAPPFGGAFRWPVPQAEGRGSTPTPSRRAERGAGRPAASARGWQLPSLPRRALCVGEPDPRTNLERVLGTLDGGLGCFPCDSGPLRPESHSCAPHSEMPRPRWRRYPLLLVLASSTSAWLGHRPSAARRAHRRSAALLAFRGKPDILDLG